MREHKLPVYLETRKDINSMKDHLICEECQGRLEFDEEAFQLDDGSGWIHISCGEVTKLKY